MDAAIDIPRSSKMGTWLSYFLSAVPALMMLFSAVMKFVQPQPSFGEAMDHLGWNVETMTAIGVLEVVCVVVYLVPQTSVIGAVLITGYLGGAIATHVRVADPFAQS